MTLSAPHRTSAYPHDTQLGDGMVWSHCCDQGPRNGVPLSTLGHPECLLLLEGAAGVREGTLR